MKNGTHTISFLGQDYDLGCYTSKEEFANEVWSDVWAATGENANQANDAQRRAEVEWDRN